jgi:hypothetical protein
LAHESRRSADAATKFPESERLRARDFNQGDWMTDFEWESSRADRNEVANGICNRIKFNG